MTNLSYHWTLNNELVHFGFYLFFSHIRWRRYTVKPQYQIPANYQTKQDTIVSHFQNMRTKLTSQPTTHMPMAHIFEGHQLVYISLDSQTCHHNLRPTKSTISQTVTVAWLLIWSGSCWIRLGDDVECKLSNPARIVKYAKVRENYTILFNVRTSNTGYNNSAVVNNLTVYRGTT